jgi:hypothetical protein
MTVKTIASKRVAQAPSAPLPELAEFLSPFRVHFSQSNTADTLERYLTGLLSDHPHKNCETMAAVVPGTTPQRLNNLLTEMMWEEADLNRQRVKQMVGLGSEGEGSVGV